MRMTAEVMVRGVAHGVVVDCSAFRGRVSIQVDGQSMDLSRYYSLPGAIPFSLVGVPAVFRLEQTGFANAQCGIEVEGQRFELIEPGDPRERKRRALVAEGMAVMVLGIGALAYSGYEVLYAPEINLEVIGAGIFALVGGIVLLRGGLRQVPMGNENTLLQRYVGTILAGDQPLELEVQSLANGAYRITVGNVIVAQWTPVFAPREVRFDVGSPPTVATVVLKDARKNGRTSMTVIVGAKRYSLPLR